MRIGILNQFVPPEQPPTARLAGDLGNALKAAGHEVIFIGGSSQYGAVRGVRRILRDLKAHFSMALQVWRSGSLDWLICFSDPTGLPLTARLLAGLSGARLAHWAMDVYPQIAIKLGAVREGIITRAVASGMRMGYRGCDLLVALDADMAAEIAKLSGGPVEVLSPWPPAIADAVAGGGEAGSKTRRRWLYSGNLGRAHDFKTVLEAQQLLESWGADWELYFQGGGASRDEAQTLAVSLGLHQCIWTDYVEDDALLPSLLSADALIATQNPDTRGLLWPSKLALMSHLGRPIVWVGPTEGAIADCLRQFDCAKILVEPGQEGGQARLLAEWLQALPETVAKMPIEVVRANVMAERQSGCHWWLTRLQSF